MRVGAFFILLLFVSGCASLQQGKRLKQHTNTLAYAATNEKDPRVQLDSLSSSLINMINESLDYVDPKQGLKFINKYKDQNQASIEQIMTNVETWFAEMPVGEKLTTGLSLLSDKKLRQLIGLVPKFEKKYKQIQFFSRISSRIKNFTFGADQ